MEPLSDSSSRHFAVTFVCTGNRARSPFAAALLNETTRGLISTRSFGVQDLGPVPAIPEAVWAASVLGVDLTSHAARALPRGALSDDEVVIGFEPFHLSAAVVEGGAARERTFLLSELAELLGRVSATTAAQRTPCGVVELVQSVRGEAARSGRAIPDPLGRPRQDVLAIFELIGAHVGAIASKLVAAGGTRSSYGS